MCELLIKAIDANHNDPIKDKGGCYKKGDIVEVREDNAKYGQLECLPTFIVFKIPGMTKEEGLYLMESETENTTKNGKIEKNIKTRRKHNFPFEEIFTSLELNEIKNKNWSVKSIDKTKIKDKTKK